jgi:MoaA/NifB/PqqE/SkfB family radical SAM enzyme
MRTPDMMRSSYDEFALEEYPDCVVIDTTYACNVICGMCHLASPDFKIPKIPHISMQLIERMMPLLQKTKNVFLLGYGEPLMHPKIYEIVSLIRTNCPNARLTFTSNGTLLNQRNIEKLINGGLDNINISIDGPNLERGHPKIELVYANLRKLAAEKKRRGVDYPQIQIAFVIGKDNQNELLPVLGFGIEIGIVSFSITPLRIIYPNPEWDDYIRRNDIYNHLDAVVPIVQAARKLASANGIDVLTPIPSAITSSPDAQGKPLDPLVQGY